MPKVDANSWLYLGFPRLIIRFEALIIMKAYIVELLLIFAAGHAAAIPRYGQRPVPNPNAPSRFTLLHTNDIHAHFDEFNNGGTDCTAANKKSNTCYGGVARLKTLVDAYRKNSSQVLLLDAGDQFQGTLFFNIFGSSPSTEFMNKLEYDAMAIGNHEFDKGVNYLASFIKTLRFPALSSNIELRTAPALKNAGVKPYIVINKLSVGIIGYITNTTSDITTGSKNITFYDPVGPVQRHVNELRGYGIKRVICVSHNGYLADKYLAANTRGIDLIVGGHSHSLLLKNTSFPGVVGPYPTNVTNLDGKSTWVVQAHRYGNYLGHLDLEWDKSGHMLPPVGDPILMDQSVPQDPVFQKRVDELRVSFANLTQKVVGTATADFSITDCITGECAIGDLIADCMKDADPSPGPKIALMNSGGIRASFQKGNISYADVMTVLPFGDSIVSFPYTGTQIKAVLENAVSMHNIATDKPVISVAQFSGIRFSFDAQQPLGSRVVNATVDGQPLDLNTSYKMITNEFVANGGDNIMVANKLVTTGNPSVDVLSSCIQKHVSITPTVDGRFPKVRNGKP
ncbi:hypothetical protein BATDEDRAFT_36043 [Batrachochytrium dendrobatidis JAM81]|uniref:5'-Nucleotidase C-terminal domain-containing protein n=2 Tax=Batrachochytrium dendrobatidis TaxID=109871 RepID=F4PBP1_BATDJ|nr:uncharacterized protein BATDEDRAFT_36043 [Batrachochytrium dendrobatidis JAM81]EGF77480.1 hypothetical protein BATDEDRAFT_36043 [Batrachochytrium dendrobatidis JAM81]KAJ8327571.1 hypothetical protein O5D80_003926 [Batrachochytrium dendrobatidis]KAK5669208.1 hypothetical protein QVD99_003618 [Batrachochytrium dendrobatidis]OAJ37740.1 hypothetical protein BDEG_21730 [Batrachochytrium dendrobatidis JEL423]|eukprot:XP_006681996.1 hypothetical protein BATDEDRAFT_36043 [Batrachochytrium dendrobatidis JAM81]